MTAQPYRKESTLDNAELQKLTRHWQERLRLNDWIIESWVTYKNDLPGEHRDAEGLVNYNIEKKQAEIVVLHPDDAPQMIPHDMEAVLVHELLHLHFAPFTNDDPLVEVLIEQSIESITAALMNTERDQVVRFDTSQDRALAEKDELIREMQRDRDAYREKVLRQEEVLKEKDGYLIQISAMREETAKQYHHLKGEFARLQKERDRLQEDLDSASYRASAEYHQGVEDALRRHHIGSRPLPSRTSAKEGAHDVASFRTPAYLAGFAPIIDNHGRSATIRANVGDVAPMSAHPDPSGSISAHVLRPDFIAVHPDPSASISANQEPSGPSVEVRPDLFTTVDAEENEVTIYEDPGDE